MVALVDHEAGAQRLLPLALDRIAFHVEDGELVAAHDDPVAVLQIGDRIGEGGERNRIRAEEHLALAVTDSQWRTVARADDEVLVAAEHDRQRKRALEPLQRPVRRLDRRRAGGQLAAHQVGDDFRVGLRGEGVAVLLQLVAQLGEVLDDAVMDDGDAVGEMRVRVGLVGHAMRRPARVSDADQTAERLAVQLALEVDELALGAAARQFAMLDGRDAGRVIAPVFEPLQRLDEQWRDRRVADDPDNSTHAVCPDSRPPERSPPVYGPLRRGESQFAFRCVSAATIAFPD